jgi:type III secretion protein R
MAIFNRKNLLFLLLIGFICIPWVSGFAAEGDGAGSAMDQTSQVTQTPMVTQVAVLAMMALLPYAIMLLTSFLKMVVVLSLLRSALGVQNSPPNQVLNGIAMIMAIYVMFPTGLAMYEAGESYIHNSAPASGEVFTTQTAEYIVGVVDRTKEPLRDFLSKNCSAKHRSYFYKLAKKKFPPTFREKLNPKDFIVLIPSYITSQVKGAFEIGVLIYLPFFVIDLVTSNILLAMGMMMLSPLTIALPLKLLLLVMIDGWTLLVEGVVLSYR